ncbi:MAG: ATP-dependent DNA helicase [Parachlamydiales bacterium]
MGPFEPGGPISKHLPHYEPRPQQQQMAAIVKAAIERGQTALIEAGTGTGKTLAYGAPALLAALNQQKRIVISTHTINLQQQLVDKDLPFLLKALNADLKVVLVKGMYNYLCLKKLSEASAEKGSFPPDEAEELSQIEGWAQKSEDGSRSDLPIVPSGATWERVGAELDLCPGKRCPHYKECFFMSAREAAKEAQVLVVNHHLLLADLALKAESDEGGILPDYDVLILDEAHHLEEVATESWAIRLSRFEWIKLLGRLIQDKGATRLGKLPTLERQLRALEAPHALIDRVSWELPAEKKRLVGDLNDLFHLFAQFLSQEKQRLEPAHLEHSYWRNTLIPAVEGIVDRMEAFSTALRSLEADIDHVAKGKGEELKAFAARIEHHSSALKKFTFDELSPDEVRWIEAFNSKGFVQAALVSARLDISELLSERLFKSIPTVILTSATLTTSRDFSFIRQRLGLADREVVEAIFDSPFSYEEQALLVVPADMPAPNDPTFDRAASQAILQALRASRGGAFVLFTSFRMLRTCHDELKGLLEAEGYPVLRQGELERSTLLERFRSQENSILFGTDSFWEGVDVIGNALRLVILAKLPFQVPTEPIVQARLSAIADGGGDPFTQYTVPQAIVKFKQGFGRLIRHHQDRGCILCLDTRLKTKAYGRWFLESLPPCRIACEGRSTLHEVISRFYQPGSM